MTRRFLNPQRGRSRTLPFFQGSPEDEGICMLQMCHLSHKISHKSQIGEGSAKSSCHPTSLEQ